LTITSELTEVMYRRKSPYQDIWCITTSPWGKVLVLDGKTQSAQVDEKIYHESLVHPVMLSVHEPKSVFIGGGGESATVREVLKHKSVERVVMVDLDEMVVSACKQHLPEWNAGALMDPRLELHYQDAKAWLEDHKETFDVIIMDIADPIEAGPGVALYFQEFYQFVGSRLNAGGAFVTQSSGSGVLSLHECFTVIHKTLQSSFDCVFPYSVEIPSFGGAWGFNLAYNKCDGHRRPLGDNISNWDPSEVDMAIEERIKVETPLFFYDGVSHRHEFSLPKYLREELAKESRVMTKASPVFMY